MPDTDAANAQAAPAAEPQTSDQSQAGPTKATTVPIEQYQGLQRNLEKVRKELKARLDAEGTDRKIELLADQMSKLVKIVEPALTPEARKQSTALLEAAATAKKQLDEEQTTRHKIAETLAETGIDFDDSEAAVAKAHYENGNYVKAQAELDRIVKTKKVSDAERQAIFEEEARKRGLAVKTGSSTAPAGPTDARDVITKRGATKDEIIAAATKRLADLKGKQ